MEFLIKGGENVLVNVKFYSLFRINLKSSGREYNFDTEINISELIKRLDNDYDGYFSLKLLNEEGNISPGAIILLNGKNVLHLDKLKTRISDGDLVTLFPPSAGG